MNPSHGPMDHSQGYPDQQHQLQQHLQHQHQHQLQIQPQTQPQDLQHTQTSQQKRQNSLSSYMIQNASKRIPSQLPPPIESPSTAPANTSSPMHIPTSTAFAPATSTNTSLINNTSTTNSTNNVNNTNMMRNTIRRNLIQQLHQQTPTPSTYGVPSSPNSHLVPASNTSALELPDSNEGRQSPVSQQQNQPQQPLQPQPVAQQHTMTDEEQQLATKLKETYKNIVNYEEIVQKACIDLTIKINQTAHPTQPPTTQGQAQYSSSLNSMASSTSSSLNVAKSTSELLNDLWTVYHHNRTLLANYYDFLVTALKPSSNQTHFKTGKNIVDLYKISRRMWVYGIVGLLEVLKNIMNIFQDHEICSCFILYCFNLISNLTDPILEMEGWWAEKLGDLSRMAIALYSSRFIDWKISAEYWYAVSKKTLYGHGKIYYHMCTVQQDNLDALVNIGKSVFCHDPFVPTQQYLRLVVENICTQRNILSLLELPSIDFIKIHKVLLSIFPNGSTSLPVSNGSSSGVLQDTQLQYGIDLVTRYGLTFGSDSNGYNFFTNQLYTQQGVGVTSNDPHHPYYQQQQQQLQQLQHAQLGGIGGGTNSNNVEKLNFWFNKGPLFAIANINHLVGFGDARNPFAKLFELPEALKERKNKKDRKKKSRTTSIGSSNNDDLTATGASMHAGAMGMGGSLAAVAGNVNNNNAQTLSASDLLVVDWFISLRSMNKSVLELSMRILHNYLIGPRQALTSHVIVWLYFLVSVGEATNKYPHLKPMIMWLFHKMFPWNSFIKYLNSILLAVKSSDRLSSMAKRYLAQEDNNKLAIFQEKEFLPEVWKCWGTLWFDVIAPKGDYISLEEAGVINENLFDLPTCGTSPVKNVSNTTDHMATNTNVDGKTKKVLQDVVNDERIIRIFLLARQLADRYDFGLVRSKDSFAFDKQIYENIDNIGINGAFEFIEKYVLNDGRFLHNNFLQPILNDNLYMGPPQAPGNEQSIRQRDVSWFGKIGSGFEFDEDEDEGGEGEDDDVEDEDENLESYAGSDFEDRDFDYELQQPQQQQNSQMRTQHQQLEEFQQNLQHQPQHNPFHATQHLDGNGGFDQLQYLHLQQHEQVHLQQHNRMLGVSSDLTFGEPDFNQNKTGVVAGLDGNLGPRIDTNITYITLDTNIWLKHCGRIFKCIRNGIFKILIPLIVFQELRSLRKSAEATIADSATRSVIIIRELYLSKEILPLRFDGTVASDINETTEFENNSNWRTSVDETILNSVNEHDQIGKKLMKGYNVPLYGNGGNTANTGKGIVLDAKASKAFNYCILITDDRNMRLRAKTIGLNSFQSRWLFALIENIFADNCID